MNKIYLCAFILLCTIFKAESQCLTSYPVSDDCFKKAVDLYSKEMYRSSLEKMSHALKQSDNDHSLTKDDIEFYTAMSALYNEQSNASVLLMDIINATPKNIHHSEAMFGYARYLYGKGRYKEASVYFQEVPVSSIPESDKNEYYFKAGYCYFIDGKTDLAMSNFRRIKDQRNMYADAALYYYSHIEYERGNYITAKQGFDRLSTNPNYSSVVPYYTLQIAFIQKDYDKVISDGEAFLNASTESRMGEITRLIAEAYLQKGNINKASEYFQRYERATTKMTRDDYLLKGYIAYKDEDYNSAAKSFTSASASAKDSIAQLADYYLGDCSVKINSKNEALNAFKRASELSFNKTIQEDAFLNYAKLALEVQDNETPMVNYLSKYPEAMNNAELSLYRASASAKKGKYNDALGILQSISNPSPAQKEAVQRIAYVSGTELFKTEDYRQAIEMFDLSMQNAGYNNSVQALARYWKANSTYMLGNYSSALIQFENFINTAGAFDNLTEYTIAHYNIGYCYFKENKYDDALRWFRKYISFEAKSTRKTPYLGDCYNRIGDCYFKKRNYQLAAENYTTAESLGLSNPDYSALQRGISLGFTEGNDAKINALKHISRSYPNSRYIPYSYYELGRTYQQQMKYDEAMSSFQSVTSKYQSSPIYPKALLEMGLIELNRGNMDKSLSYYQQVINKAPSSPEAQDALLGVKNIYLEQNRMDEYIAYANKIGQGVKSPTERDSLIFTAAERQYQSGDCTKAYPAMVKYLEDYPAGKFLTQANFYLADCAMKEGKNADALKSYSYVVRQPRNDFTESAWSGVARANYNLKNYSDAAAAFEQVKALAQTPTNKLDAEIGRMRSYVAMGDNAKAADAAKIVAASTGISDDTKREANLIMGRAYQQSGEYNKAIETLKPLAKNMNLPIDAEAQYRIIDSYYELKKYKEAEEEVYALSSSGSKQQYWIAKSFTILGNIYVHRKDLNQAKATYESVINGYPNKDDGVVNEAKAKLAEIVGE